MLHLLHYFTYKNWIILLFNYGQSLTWNQGAGMPEKKKKSKKQTNKQKEEKKKQREGFGNSKQVIYLHVLSLYISKSKADVNKLSGALWASILHIVTTHFPEALSGRLKETSECMFSIFDRKAGMREALSSSFGSNSRSKFN